MLCPGPGRDVPTALTRCMTSTGRFNFAEVRRRCTAVCIQIKTVDTGSKTIRYHLLNKCKQILRILVCKMSCQRVAAVCLSKECCDTASSTPRTHGGVSKHPHRSQRPLITMLLLLLFTYFAHNATQALTIPLGHEDQSEALFPRLGDQYFDDRSVWSIVWSCLATLFACSWVAVHPNVPRATDSEALIFGRRLATMGYMLLAPELIIFWAAKQHFSAKEIEGKYQGWNLATIHYTRS